MSAKFDKLYLTFGGIMNQLATQTLGQFLLQEFPFLELKIERDYPNKDFRDMDLANPRRSPINESQILDAIVRYLTPKGWSFGRNFGAGGYLTNKNGKSLVALITLADFPEEYIVKVSTIPN